MSVEEIVKDVLINDIGMDDVEVSPNSRLKEDLGVDSTELVEVIAALEKKFKIKIPEGVIGLRSSVKDIVNFLNNVKVS
ncbi:MAG: acyl carrier protein [Nitrospirae bacterium]|nr:acyl carrier protein [Nitrospirota bacterium]